MSTIPVQMWSPLQVRVTMAIANAKYDEFRHQAYLVGDLVRLRLLPLTEAADLMQEAAEYNQLVFEYGPDRIQKLMCEGLSDGGAA